MSEFAFFQDLAVLMAVAGIVSAIFARLGWPKVLGYIAAGVFMSEYTWGGSFLADPGSISTIGQLGVIFLMFTMGLDFSPSQMKRIRTVAMPVAIVDTVVMTWLGYTVGHLVFGWDTVPSLFLGLAICDSATTMLAKVIDEMRWGDRPFVRYALGSSVCEDIVCVGLIALVTGVANGKGLSLMAAGTSLGGLCVFFLAVIVFGMIIVPRTLTSVAKSHDDEALLLTILGCLFLVSFLAYKMEFSSALGAFLVGILGASSDVRSRLSDMVSPLKSMFSAMFFVSIGLLMNPAACFHHLPAILLVSAVVLGGKFLNCTIVSLLTGQGVKTSVQIGMSMAQIGEFAFMVAMIYINLTGEDLCSMYDIVVAVSVLTTLLNPILIRHSSAVGDWIDARLPSRSRSGLAAYRGFVEKLRASDRDVLVHRVIRNNVIQLAVIGVLIFAVSVMLAILAGYDWTKFSQFFECHKRFFFCLAANLFAVAMLAPVLNIGRTLGRSVASVIVGSDDTRWQQALRPIVMLVVMVGILLLLFIEMSMINVNLKPDELWARWAIRLILLIAAVFGWRFFAKAAKRAATRFNEAVGAEERRARLGDVMTFVVPEDNVRRLTLDADSPAIGSTVVSLNLRAKTGATVISIERGGTIIRNAIPTVELCVGDVLLVMGESQQISALKDLLGIVSQS